jgi:hypothetical protein
MMRGVKGDGDVGEEVARRVGRRRRVRRWWER